jgi:hypothetical protein
MLQDELLRGGMREMIQLIRDNSLFFLNRSFKLPTETKNLLMDFYFSAKKKERKNNPVQRRHLVVRRFPKRANRHDQFLMLDIKIVNRQSLDTIQLKINYYFLVIFSERKQSVLDAVSSLV